MVDYMGFTLPMSSFPMSKGDKVSKSYRVQAYVSSVYLSDTCNY
jgi:hypothetical protein